MANLELSAARTVAPGLPEFVGDSIPAKLQDGRAKARAIILKYVPNFRFDQTEARNVMSEVNVWIERNEDELADAMDTGQTNLPQALQLLMGTNKKVQQWVIANYTIAAAGMGPWESGKIAELAKEPSSNLSEAWALSDAKDRLESFGLIVKMENDGTMRDIFEAPAGTSGLGVPVAPVIVWAIVVAVVALAAVIASYFYLARRLQLNNALMRDICAKAQAEGDQITVKKCLEATKELQVGDPFSALVGTIGKTVMVLGGVYLGLKYFLPWATGELRGREKST